MASKVSHPVIMGIVKQDRKKILAFTAYLANRDAQKRVQLTNQLNVHAEWSLEKALKK